MGSIKLLDQVRSTIGVHGLVAPGDRLVAGVSGGPDSLALLHVLYSLREPLEISLHVAHLDHQLRGPASAADAAFVADLAQRWGLPATVGARDVATYARERRLSIEEAARHARYEFLAEVARRVGATRIAVAHNADDQVETILMHFLRGAGLGGLRGMAYQSALPFPFAAHDSSFATSHLILIRPLLDIPRAEIEAYCTENGLAPRVDSSNLDQALFRNRLRHEVLPYLERLNPNLRQVLLHTGHALADDYDLLQGQVREAFTVLAREEDGIIVLALAKWRALAPALQRGTLREAVRVLRSELRDFDWDHVEGARRIALDKATGALATLPQDLLLRVGYDELLIGPAAQVRNARRHDLPQLAADRLVVPVPGRVALPGSLWAARTAFTDTRVVPDRWTVLLDAGLIEEGLALRPRRPGDTFQPSGMKGKKSLHEFMIDEKIPRDVRERLPLLVSGDRILWVCGWRVDERARVTPATRRILQVTMEKDLWSAPA